MHAWTYKRPEWCKQKGTHNQGNRAFVESPQTSACKQRYTCKTPLQGKTPDTFWEIGMLGYVPKVKAHECVQHMEKVQGIRELSGVAGL